MKIRTIIVDDEPLAREKIERFAKQERDIQIVALCGNGHEAITAFNKFKPALIFLDIQMPELTGFEVLRRISARPFPAVIFTTAFDEFALRAFEYHAIDYLLKPFNRERFHSAVDHAREILASKNDSVITSDQIANLLDAVHKKEPSIDRLIVKTNKKIIFLKLDEVEWIEAAGNYVKLHSGSSEHLVRETLSNFQQQLDPQKFIRVHRSTIVNVDYIKELQPWFNGDYKILLKSSTQVVLSRGFRENFTKVFGKPL